MELTPEGQEQEWLIQSMVEFVAAHGWEEFLFNPILEATPEYFPESSGSTPFLIDRTARRLLHYAGLGEIDVVLAPLDFDDEHQRDASPIMLLGLDDGAMILGVQVDFTPDAEDIAGTLSHVVAQAFRHHHGLVHEDAQEEALLAEATTVFLGFGILTANSALRYRSGGDFQGNWVVSAWETTRFGSLTPQALTYSLALQAQIRDLDKSAIGAIQGSLETNQAAFFASAIKLFKGKAPGLRATLGLPEPAEWPEPRSFFPLPELPDYAAGALEAVEVVDQVREANIGRPTFRVRQLRPYPVLGVVLGGIFGAMVRAAFSLEPSVILLLGILGGLAGLYYAFENPYDVCSDPDCNRVMPPLVDDCPGCGRPIRGRIRHQDDRLEAEERIVEDGETWIDD